MMYWWWSLAEEGSESLRRGLSRRTAIHVGLAAALAGATATLLNTSAAHAAGWGGYSNGQIPLSALSSIPWATNRYLRSDAVTALIALNRALRQQFSYDLPINDGYRNYAGQVDARNYWCGRGKCQNAAVPGTSNHGWALAVDISIGQFDWNHPLYLWMKSNGWQYGWFHPSWAEPSGYAPEAWHWEYNGSWQGATPVPNPVPDAPPDPALEEDDMFIINSPGRGIALVAPGYFRSLSGANDFEEVNAARQIARYSFDVSDGRFDTVRDICTSGFTPIGPPGWPGATIHTPQVQLQPAVIDDIVARVVQAMKS